MKKIKKSLLLVFMLLCNISETNASQNKQNWADVLVEAEDYIIVDPSRTFDLLNVPSSPPQLNASQTTRWYLAKLRASIKLNHLNEIKTALISLLNQRDEEFFISNAASIFRVFGIAMRKLEYLNLSKESYSCAMKLANRANEKASLLANIAILARHLGDYKLAYQANEKGVSLARKIGSDRLIATFENNVGSLELDVGNLPQAEAHYRLALAKYQAVDKRSGIITASLNLLLVFAIQKDTLSFQRLIGPSKRLLAIFPNESKLALLQWLEVVNQFNNGKIITEDSTRKLTEAFQVLESEKLKTIIKNHFGNKLNIALPSVVPKVTKSLPPPNWFPSLDNCLDLKNDKAG